MKVLITFASHKITPAKYVTQLRKAIESAHWNLGSRFGVTLSEPRLLVKGSGAASVVGVVIDVTVPDDFEEKTYGPFIPGRRLRGISAYLLKKWPDTFKQYLVGSRLLYYTDISALPIKENEEDTE